MIGFCLSIRQLKNSIDEFGLKDKHNILVCKNDFYLLIKIETHLIIGDVGYFNPSETDKLINTLKKLSFELCCKKIIFTLSPNHWLFSALNKYIESKEDLPIGFYLYSDKFEPTEIQFTHADYDTF